MHHPGLIVNLASFDLLDLVQAIHLDRRAISLVARNGTQNLGVLHFLQGELLWAEFQGLRGEEAFIALAAQTTGSIEQLPWDGQGERNVSQPLSRLIMQAASQRDARGDWQSPQSQEQENGQQQAQSRSNGSGPAHTRKLIHGPDSHPPASNGHTRSPNVELPDDLAVPSWVREIRASASVSMQQTDILPAKPAATPAGALPAVSDDAADRDDLPRGEGSEESNVPIQPTLPLSALNGKMTLPSLGNGNRASHQPPAAQPEPPTVPLPAVQGGLRDYAPRREPPVLAAPKAVLRPPEAQEEGFTARGATSGPIRPTPSPPPAPLPAPAVSEMPAEPAPRPLPQESPAAALPAAPAGMPSQAEAKPSGLSILEQLAYGNLTSNGSVEQSPAGEETVPPPAPAPLEQAVPEPPAQGKPPQQPPTEAVPPQQTPAGAKQLQQVLESFVDQVGSACIATALVRTDGSLVADFARHRNEEQELNSPAYHLAHVMQSSLRALLMGGWGDLEETMITGSTHLVVLRRLGRPEKGVFHVAVLERSGNPGLCRVRMRGSEPALLQSL